MPSMRCLASQLGELKILTNEGVSEGLIAIAQQIISEPAVHLTGSHVTPVQVRLFLKALEEVYAVDPVDTFVEPREIWRDPAYHLSLSLIVDYADMGRLSSRRFYAILAEKNAMYPGRVHGVEELEARIHKD